MEVPGNVRRVEFRRAGSVGGALWETLFCGFYKIRKFCLETLGVFRFMSSDRFLCSLLLQIPIILAHIGMGSFRKVVMC